MTTLKEFRKAFWKKGVIFGLSLTLYLYLLMLLFSYLTHGEVLNPIFVLIIGVAVSLGSPLLMNAFSRPKRTTTREYNEVEKEFEERGNSLVVETFGPDVFQAMFVDDHNWFPTQAIDTSIELLQRGESKNNPELKFHLLMKLATYYAKDARPREAIGNLQEALAITPDSLIANHRIATLFERMGSGNQAIAHYQLAKGAPNLSKNLKDYLETQIRRVTTNGPRREGPYNDSGFQWLPG